MPKTRLTQYRKYVFFFRSNNLQLKFGFSINHYKCTGHTSNKVDKLSPDIIPTRIDFENLKINYPHYSRSLLFELPSSRLDLTFQGKMNQRNKKNSKIHDQRVH